MVIHKAVVREIERFGAKATLTTTLCGRMNGACRDGLNSSANDAEVTCKFCLRRMAATLR